MKNGLNSTGGSVIEMETRGDNMEPDGHEGDDERTSGPSGSEMAEKDIEDKIQDEEVDTTSAGAGNSDNSEVKPMRIQKKHRRGSRRNRKKYKPYTKMTWDEKKARLELDAKKANKMREQYTNQKGRPAAPYNTTQFLMEEHDQEEPDLGNHTHMQSDGEAEEEDCDSRSTERRRQDSQSFDDPDLEDYNESPEDEIYEQEFFQKDFTEAYEQYHAESLYSMKKDELVRECMSLEERVETLERKLRQVSSDNGLRDTFLEELPYRSNGDSLNADDSSSSSNASEDLVRTLRSELNRLKTENARLQLAKTKTVQQPAVCMGE